MKCTGCGGTGDWFLTGDWSVGLCPQCSGTGEASGPSSPADEPCDHDFDMRPEVDCGNYAKHEAALDGMGANSTGDCRSDEGVIVGLIDGVIASARVIAKYFREQQYRTDHRDVVQALEDLRSDQDVADVTGSAPIFADGVTE
jgi:hypothetical protein